MPVKDLLKVSCGNHYGVFFSTILIEILEGDSSA